MKIFLDVAAAFIIALLSGMGVGSAGLLVVWLTVADAVPQLAAQGLNLYFFLFSSSASLLIHVRRRKIFWTAAAFMICIGAVGAISGTALSSILDAGSLRKLFGGMLVFCGSMSLYGILSHERARKAATK